MELSGRFLGEQVADFNIPRQKAEVINNAENIYYNTGLQRDHRTLGLEALRRKHYGEASSNLADALRDNPSSLDLHYYLALALLGGIRPNRHDRRTIASVRTHLSDASELPEARILLTLVNEDYGLFWRVYSVIPTALRNLINETGEEHIEEILRHVPAPEARTWQLLANEK